MKSPSILFSTLLDAYSQVHFLDKEAILPYPRIIASCPVITEPHGNESI
jgi:hypothetical protein